MNYFVQKIKRGLVLGACAVLALSEISAPEPSFCAQAALGVIELAAQRDPRYAQFLEKFLKLPQFSEEYT